MDGGLRYADYYLSDRQADKALPLVLTDSKPSDIDGDDQQLLIQDTGKAEQKLDQEGIYTYWFNLDPDADEYVEVNFGKQYTVADGVERSPEKLPLLFASLTS